MTQAEFLQKFGKRFGYKPLTESQIDFVVRKGEWLVNAYVLTTPMEQGVGAIDPVAFAGQGIPDLDHLLLLWENYPWSRYYIDLGGPSSFTESFLIGPDDINNIRAHYIEVWGTVSRPQYWANQPQTINGSQDIGIAWP